MRQHQLALAFVLASGVGCSIGIACSKILCESGLRVTFASPVPTTAHVEVLVTGSSAPVAADCGATPDVTCALGVFFPDFTAESATVTVTTPQGTSQHPVQPHYEPIRPNGPHCGPVCDVATVTLTLP